MREDELKAAFDRQAAGYDEQWEKMAPIRDGLVGISDHPQVRGLADG